MYVISNHGSRSLCESHTVMINGFGVVITEFCFMWDHQFIMYIKENGNKFVIVRD